MEEKSSILIYSLPNESDHFTCVLDQLNTANPEELEAQSDFVFMPFDNSMNKALHFQIKEKLKNHAIDVKVDEHFDGPFQSREDYNLKFDATKQAIASGQIDKMVLSRIKFVDEPIDDIYQYYLALKREQENSFCYLLKHPEIGTWIGATPEAFLLQIGSSWTTIALAGTQLLDKPIADIRWRKKEKDEHLFIEKFIEEALHEEEIAFSKTERYTSPAGNVCHIKSEYVFPHTSGQIKLFNALHPGPAISGYPKAEAIAMIKEIENYDRAYYTGYLGFVKDEIQTYINLRCMRIYKNGMALYLGGGITSASSKDAEWNETEYKSMTLLNVLQKTLS